MSRILTFSNALLSLRGRIDIGDEHGKPVYEARGEFSLFSPTWRVHAQGNEVVRVRKRLLAWRPTWDVQVGHQRMVVRRKLLAFNRVHHVEGGPYDGATLTGNLWDLSFAIRRGPQVLARARSKLLSLRDVHTVEVLSDAPADELFVVAAMLVVMLDKRDNKHD